MLNEAGYIDFIFFFQMKANTVPQGMYNFEINISQSWSVLSIGLSNLLSIGVLSSTSDWWSIKLNTLATMTLYLRCNRRSAWIKPKSFSYSNSFIQSPDMCQFLQSRDHHIIFLVETVVIYDIDRLWNKCLCFNNFDENSWQ